DRASAWHKARSLGGRNFRGEKVAARGQIFDDSPAHSGSMGQEAAEIWTTQALLQPGRFLRPRLLIGGKLFVEDALLEVVLGVEQQAQPGALGLPDGHRVHVAHLEEIRGGADRALARAQDPDADLGAMRPDRATPAPRA